jgi:hypothetical protein
MSIKYTEKEALVLAEQMRLEALKIPKRSAMSPALAIIQTLADSLTHANEELRLLRGLAELVVEPSGNSVKIGPSVEWVVPSEWVALYQRAKFFRMEREAGREPSQRLRS